MKILLIEDNRAISKGLVYTLEQNGFEVALCENAESTLNSLGGDFDLFIVDVSLPDGNGFELCDEIKRVCETPVIFLTALDDEDSIVKGFDLGAEDYITKPFSSRELLARIKRITKKLDKTMAMNFGDISIDFDKKQVCKNGDPVVLTALEYRLFAMLAKNSGKVLRVGAAARSMLGRTPGNVVAVHPLQDGVISDYELTARMLTEMLRRVLRHAIVKPRMIVTVPSGITEVEERAVIQAAMEAGARRVYLIEAPLAAALGAQLDITAPEGRMVVDIGGGTTDIGVLTMNGIAQSASLKVAGAAFDEAIIRHLRRRYGLLIGTTVAEEIKMSIGCVTPRPEALTMTVKGRDLKNGLAREATLASEELMEVLRRPARQIMDKVLDVLESTTPELVADIARNGIVLTGGGSQLFGMDRLLCERTEMTCVVADDADSCAAYGCGKSLSWMNHMQEGTINLARRRLLKE